MFNSKKAIVYEELKNRILLNELLPGYPLNEGELASELNVSKTPVREALRLLESEGFIEIVSGRGAIVSYINHNDIKDIFQLREIVEAGAAKRASMMRNTKELEDKRVELIEILQREKNGGKRVESFGEWEDVHYLIVKSLGNNALLNMYDSLLDNIARIKNYYKGKFEERSLEDILSEHILIISAIIDNHTDEAENHMVQHLRKVGEYINGFN